jgi:hypothetical protein
VSLEVKGSCASLGAVARRPGGRRPPFRRAASAGALLARADGLPAPSQQRSFPLKYKLPPERPSSGGAVSLVKKSSVARPKPNLDTQSSPSPSPSASASAPASASTSSKSLGAGALFEEAIRRDSTYGELLREIKEAYESFLGAQGLTVPEDPVGVLQADFEDAAVLTIATGESAAASQKRSGQSSSRGKGGDSMGELLVDAARQRCFEDVEGEDQEADEEEDITRVLAFERENAALRKLIGRLRRDISTGVPVGASGNAIIEGGGSQRVDAMVLGSETACSSVRSETSSGYTGKAWLKDGASSGKGLGIPTAAGREGVSWVSALDFSKLKDLPDESEGYEESPESFDKDLETSSYYIFGESPEYQAEEKGLAGEREEETVPGSGIFHSGMDDTGDRSTTGETDVQAVLEAARALGSTTSGVTRQPFPPVSPD